MKKRILAVMLAMAMAFSLAACSSGSSETETETDTASSEESADTVSEEEEETDANFTSIDEVTLIDTDEFSLVVTGFDAVGDMLEAEFENKSYDGGLYDLSFEYVYVNGLAAYAYAVDLDFEEMPAAGESQTTSICLYSTTVDGTISETVGDVTDIQLSVYIAALEEDGANTYMSTEVLASSDEDVHIYPDGEENASVYETEMSNEYADEYVTIGCNGEITDYGILVYVQNTSDQYLDVVVESATIDGTTYDGLDESSGSASGYIALDPGYAGYIEVCVYDNDGNVIDAESLEAVFLVEGYERPALDEILDWEYDWETLSTITITLPDCQEVTE